MMVLAMSAGILFAIALSVREHLIGRERASHVVLIEQLRANLDSTRAQMRRLSEDFYVLQTVLTDHHVLDETEMARSRARLIEDPRRITHERDLIERKLGLASTHLILDDGDSKIH